MNKIKYCFASLLFLFGAFAFAQEEEAKEERKPGHYNQSKFKQLYEEFSTPNTYRSASGGPGPDYYQQQADYKMDITLDDKNPKTPKPQNPKTPRFMVRKPSRITTILLMT